MELRIVTDRGRFDLIFIFQKFGCAAPVEKTSHPFLANLKMIEHLGLGMEEGLFVIKVHKNSIAASFSEND